MTGAEQLTTLSVRGRAERTVAPDVAQLRLTAGAVEDSARAARDTLADVVDRVRSQLAELGAVALTADTERANLMWSARSMQVSEEMDHGRRHPPYETGRFGATAEISVVVRDFAVLPAVLEAVTADDAVCLHDVNWSVDQDNAAWALVRADAIGVAMGTARDYATALGGRVVSVEHVADAGLLGGGDHFGGHESIAFAASARSAGGGAPSLDPVPQTVSAVIEARFTATSNVPD